MNVILKHAAPPPPPPPPEQIEITLDKSEANRLLTLLSQIDEDGLRSDVGADT